MEKKIDKLQNFDEIFGMEKQCLEYLFRLRWPDGYRCPRCQHDKNWPIGEKKYKCRKCGYQTTVTAGTFFQDSHLPMTLWFKAIWYVCSQTGCTNALDLQKELGLGSYRTAWNMLLKIRKLMAGNVPIKFGGKVAVEEYRIYRTTWKNNSKVYLAAEIRADGKVGNICMDIACNCSHENFCTFLNEHIETNSIVISPYYISFWDSILRKYKFKKMHTTKDGEQLCMPITHSIVKWLKNRGLLDNQPIRSSREHVQSCLTECCYKFNSRNKSTAEMFTNLLCSAVLTDKWHIKNLPGNKRIVVR